MARAELDIVVRDANGRAVVGATTTILARYDDSAVTFYDSESGGSTVTTFTTDAAGRVTGSTGQRLWLDPTTTSDATGRLTVTATSGMATYTIYPDLVSAADIGGRELLRLIKADANATATTQYPTRTDITGLSGAFTVASGQLIMAELWVPAQWNTGGASELSLFSLMESSTELAYGADIRVGATSGRPMSVRALEAPTVGSHTYKISLSRGGSTGTATGSFSAGDPGFFRVVSG